MTQQKINTHGLWIEFGKHKGERWTRVPFSYLRWIVCSMTDKPQIVAIAQAEIERRGGERPELDISAHAVDRASLRCRKRWHEDRGEDEGLYSWLTRITLEAVKDGTVDEQGRYRWKGMKLVIEIGNVPILKSISG